MKFNLFIWIAGSVFFLCPFWAAAKASSDNAANLYIKCIERFKKLDNNAWKQVKELYSSKTLISSPEAKAFIEEQRKNSLIADIDAASKVKDCDWKLDLSKGFALEIPYLADIKGLATLLCADGKLAALQGDCETAIQRYLTVWRIGHHRAGKTSIECLVSISIVGMSETGLRQTLEMCTMDTAQLTALKKEFLTESNRMTEPYRLAPIKDCFLGEKEALLTEVPKITLGMLENHMDTESLKKYKERIRGHFKADNPNTPDPTWIAASIQYIENHFDTILAAIDKPYPAATTEFKQANEKIQKDADSGNDAAAFSAILLPDMEKMYDTSIRIRTQCNALLTAIDVYIATKQTGQLPTELPNTLYVDRFSGKPFIYETTPTGFRLRCRQEDINKKKTWEWEYTVKQS